MADFPATKYVQRETENLPGIVYDPTKKQNLYSEDIQNLGGEIEAIENIMGTGWDPDFGGLHDYLDEKEAIWDAKQPALGFTPENVANKDTTATLGTSDTKYPSQKAVKTYVDNGLGGKISASSTDILSNKRNTPRVYNVGSNTSLTPEIATYDIFEITALAGALTINNYSTSTPSAGEKMIIRIKDNGTARAISFGTKYRALGVALPTTTVISKTMYLGFIWNVADTTWDLIALAQQA